MSISISSYSIKKISKCDLPYLDMLVCPFIALYEKHYRTCTLLYVSFNNKTIKSIANIGKRGYKLTITTTVAVLVKGN